MSANWVAVAKLGDVPDEGTFVVSVGGEPACLYNDLRTAACVTAPGCGLQAIAPVLRVLEAAALLRAFSALAIARLGSAGAGAAR